MNSFLQLHEEDVDQFVQNHQESVRRSVEGRVRTVYMIGDIFELFFPRLADTLTVLMGGDVIDPEDMYLTIEEEDDLDLPDFPSPAPGGWDDTIR